MDDTTRTIIDAAAEHLPPSSYHLHTGDDRFIPVTVKITGGNSKVEVESGERFLREPLRVTQAPTFETPEAFSDYVNAFSSGETRIFASLDDRRVVARIDYHQPGGSPSRATHTATLPVRFDDSFDAWAKIADKPLGQRAFAEFLEDRAEDAVLPDPASLMEVAGNFQAVRNVEFKSAINVSTGERQFRYEEKDHPAGAVTCPKMIAMRTPVFYGTPPVNWVARLNYDISDGKLIFTVRIHRLRELLDREFNEVVGMIQNLVGATAIHRGRVA